MYVTKKITIAQSQPDAKWKWNIKQAYLIERESKLKSGAMQTKHKA